MSEKHKFIEREVEVEFGDGWKVIKLDEHRYYRRVSGMGLSAVDFLAVHEEFGLVLIEMKNYTQGMDTIDPELYETMESKREGSLRLINIVFKYYQRQWYFGLLTFFGWEYLYPKEWLVWIQAKGHLDSGNYFFLGNIDY